MPVRADDLELREFAPGSVPDRALSASQARGRLLAVPVRRGEPITDRRVLGTQLGRAFPGTVLTPVRVGDPEVVRLLRVGDRINLIATDPQRPGPVADRSGTTGAGQLLATGVPVVALPRPRPESTDLTTPGTLVVLAVPSASATEVSVSGVSGFLTITMSR